MHRKILAVSTSCLLATATALHAESCQIDGPDIFDGFTLKDISQLIDLPDPETVRAVQLLERPWVDRIISGELQSFSKSWCDIGIQDMIVELRIPVEDDAIRAIEQRALYVWDSSGEPVGWRIEALGERFQCARGDDPYAALCP